MAIEHNCVNSMYSLGHYYQYKEKDYELMKKYYLIAIKHNCIDSMFTLGHYYGDVEKDYEQKKIYYLMAINKKILFNGD